MFGIVCFRETGTIVKYPSKEIDKECDINTESCFVDMIKGLIYNFQWKVAIFAIKVIQFLIANLMQKYRTSYFPRDPYLNQLLQELLARNESLPYDQRIVKACFPRISHQLRNESFIRFLGISFHFAGFPVIWRVVEKLWRTTKQKANLCKNDPYTPLF